MPIWVFSMCQISLGSRFNYVIKKAPYLVCSQKDLEPHGYDGDYNRQGSELLTLKLTIYF